MQRPHIKYNVAIAYIFLVTYQGRYPTGLPTFAIKYTLWKIDVKLMIMVVTSPINLPDILSKFSEPQNKFQDIPRYFLIETEMYIPPCPSLTVP